MQLNKDSSIVVTKTAHTAEKFIEKKIELLVSESMMMNNQMFVSAL